MKGTQVYKSQRFAPQDESHYRDVYKRQGLMLPTSYNRMSIGDHSEV